MMQKVILSNEQLNQIDLLRKSGSKWLQIEKATGIKRAIAKREYEKWEREQSLTELKEARKDVAAEAFREHVNYLIKIAGILTNSRWVPTVNDRTLTVDKFLDRIWGTANLAHYLASTGLNLRQNYMLFESLKTHTNDRVQWKDLDEWKKEWNVCIGHISDLREEALKLIDTFLAKEESAYPSLAVNIKKHTQPDRPYERMAEAIVSDLLRRLESDKMELIPPVTKIFSQGKECQLVYFNSSVIVLKFSNNDIASAKATDRACNAMAKELFKQHEKDSIQSLRNSISTIRRVGRRFEEALDPLVLRPMILRSRCDLCPA